MSPTCAKPGQMSPAWHHPHPPKESFTLPSIPPQFKSLFGGACMGRVNYLCHFDTWAHLIWITCGEIIDFRPPALTGCRVCYECGRARAFRRCPRTSMEANGLSPQVLRLLADVRSECRVG